jgi:DNA-directed RNA polymerase specialized sigma24 family protein
VSPRALPPQQPEGAPPSKPGRKLGPIVPGVGAAHRRWLEILRDSFLESGMTVGEAAALTGWAKSKVSELLRGAGLYPRWEITHSLLSTLDLPAAPMLRLWAEAAREASKKPGWIDGCIRERSPGVLARSARENGGRPTMPRPPVSQRAFAELRRPDYLAYARVFLTRPEQAESAVREAFDLLLLGWNRALASSNLNAHAWELLRDCVMRRAPHTDGRPELSAAAFETVALAEAPDDDARFSQMEESLRLFGVLGGLPDAQLDVMVLRHLREMPEGRVADVLGISVAMVRSALRHARHHLEDTLSQQRPAPGGGAA